MNILKTKYAYFYLIYYPYGIITILLSPSYWLSKFLEKHLCSTSLVSTSSVKAYYMIAVFPQDSSQYIRHTAVIKDCEVRNYELYTIR